MCVKYTQGSCIPEEDMSKAVFLKLLPSLAGVKTLILNGIGESLLHPDLTEIIRLAREHLPTNASIGLQSNGLLLTRQLAYNLLQAGLDTICLSVDGFDNPDRKKPGEHSFHGVQNAIDHLILAKNEMTSTFRIGLEIVLTRQTINDLPGLIEWAAEKGVDYILSSHLILYDQTAEQENLFNPHPRQAIELFNKYCDTASTQGLNFDQQLVQYRRRAGTQSPKFFLHEVSRMLDEAKNRDIQLNFSDLHQSDINTSRDLQKILDAAKELAKSRGIEVFIPPLQAISPRECRFLKEKAVFIAANGDVMPCHFLWHSYSCRILKEQAKVTKRPFGNVSHKTLETIWASENYSGFRKEAEKYAYTYCWTCSQGPCPSLLSDDGSYANDCYGSQVPCGHCQWNLGGIRCL
jgi:putative metalloenzyme radical SAM/SPASM domain maturase